MRYGLPQEPTGNFHAGRQHGYYLAILRKFGCKEYKPAMNVNRGENWLAK